MEERKVSKRKSGKKHYRKKITDKPMMSDYQVNKVLDEIQEDIDEIVTRDKFQIPPFIKFLMGLFMILLLLGWLVPSYYIKANPSPKYIPELNEVFEYSLLENSTIGEFKNKYLNYSRQNQYILLIDEGILDVKIFADRISSLACDYGENYHICQVKALYYFVRNEFDYVKDPKAYDYIKSPIESFYSGGGDCDDAAVLLASMLESIGINTRLVFVPNHVYVEAYVVDAPFWYRSYKGQNWITLDATCKNCEFSENTLKNIKYNKNYLYFG